MIAAVLSFFSGSSPFLLLAAVAAVRIRNSHRMKDHRIHVTLTTASVGEKPAQEIAFDVLLLLRCKAFQIYHSYNRLGYLV